MTVEEVVLERLRDRYVILPRQGTVELAREITVAVLNHLHETGALSCPPEDLDG